MMTKTTSLIIGLLFFCALHSCGGKEYTYCECAQPESEKIIGSDEDYIEFQEYCQETYFNKLTKEENEARMRECSE